MAATTSKQPPEEEPKIQALLFKPLAADGHNYLEWSVDVDAYLHMAGLEQTLVSPTPADIPSTSVWKALVTIRKHLHTSLRQQYIQVKNPGELWKLLTSRYHHEQAIFLPQA